MMNRRKGRWFSGTRALAAGVVLLTALLGVSSAEPVVSRVTYVSGSSIYIAAGAKDGLVEGDQVELLRGENVVAVLQVVETSARRAVCRQASGEAIVGVGDAVRFARKARAAKTLTPAATTLTPAAAPEKRSSRRSLADAGLRGRIGVRFVAVRERSGEERGYRQPGIDFFLAGAQVGGAPIDLAFDMRTRRTYRSLSGGRDQNESRSRLYRAAVAWRRPGQPLSVTLGRQFSPSLAVVSLFDGALVEHRRERWAAGVFAGAQPDPEDYGFSGDVREYGGFIEWSNTAGAERRWAVGTGVVASYQDGEINREFAFVQARVDDRKLSAYFAGEVDVNRGWREEAEQDSWTVTNTFASLRYRFSDAFRLNAGYDDRRNPRLYRDYITPETEFDDRHRQGFWLGADGRVGRRVAWGLSARRSEKRDGASADSYTGRLQLSGLTRRGLSAGVRSTYYTNQFVEGWLHSASLGLELAPWSHVEVHGGVRDETVLEPTVLDDQLTWFGVQWDAAIARRWLIGVSLERSQHAYEGSDQLYTFVSYRF